jgi:D-ribose pyranose/furanose isomerase RbsD
MAKHNLYKQAPAYAPNAVPSPAGWRDPRTNELLVAIKLNMSDFDDAVAVVVEETVVEQTEVVNDQAEVAPEAVEQTEEVAGAELETEAANVEQTEEVSEVTEQPTKQTKTKNSKK